MIVNYLKLAIKILWRKKFFTFISLFGISFTLMILTLLIAFLDNQMGANVPLSNKDRMVLLHKACMRKDQEVTYYDIDTSVVDGVQVFDTVDVDVQSNSSISNSTPSYYLLNTYFRDIDQTEKHAIFSDGMSFDTYVKGKKLNLQALFCEADYWQIFDFKFLEGGPFQHSAVEDQQPVIVINETTRDEYFGYGVEALGKEMVVNKSHFKVIGVVAKVSNSNRIVSSDVFFPITHAPESAFIMNDFLGGFNMVYLLNNSNSVQTVKDQIDLIAENMDMPNPEEFDKLQITTSTISERQAQMMIYYEESEKSYSYLTMVLLVVISFFILVPTLNLINVNVTRIMERSSEIGVRKAFGANVKDLLLQFIFENIIITLIGGVIGFILSIAAIQLLNDSEILPRTVLNFNLSVFFYGLLVTLVFGIISGITPAYKMSRLSIINALKNS